MVRKKNHPMNSLIARILEVSPVMVSRECSKLVLALLFLVSASATVVLAQTSTFVNGTVIGPNEKPVAGARVEAHGNNTTLVSSTDSSGKFSFSSLQVGTYTIEASAPAGQCSAQVDLSNEGTTVTLHLLSTIGKVSTFGSSSVHSSGTDVVLNQNLLARSPAAGSFPEILLQLPGAARGANGVVHINGDHGDYNYIVDGVPVPQELNREIGSEIDPSDVSFVDILEGADPAQYGDRFGAVININTKVGSTLPGFSGYVQGGSFGTYDSSIGYHNVIGAGSLVLNLRGERSDRFLDPPNFTAVHDAGSDTNQFLRYTVTHGNDYTNFTLVHSYQVFQIPNDVESGQPASTDDNETQDDTFATLQFHHTLHTNGSLTYGIGFKRSRIRDFGDPNNDFTFGGYSLFSDRTSRDVILNIDDYVSSPKHAVRYGASYDVASVQKLYAVTLQPGNFLAPIFNPGNPGAAFTVTDNAPNVGQTAGFYAQDSWTMGSLWQLDYGLRYDTFHIFSTQFSRFFNQLSPRVKLTRLYGSRASAYLYVGRFFEPFSLENVSPTAAELLNLPSQPVIAQFDLRPERATNVEIGGHLPIGNGELGVRAMQKIAVDLIDDTQVGTTALHQDINYARGNVSTQSAYYQHPLARFGRAYIALTHTRAVNKGCETQLLAPCFGAPDDWTPADHDQRWDASAGVLINDTRGGWFAVDGEYGSGLSSGFCEPVSDECKVPPHTTLDLSKGIAVGKGGSAVTLRIRNIFNDRYKITYLNAQGNHYAAGRTFELGWQFGSH